MSVSIDRVTALIEATAAEEVLPRFRSLAETEVREKAGGELVTVADEATEARLAEGLCDLLPGSDVIGEEAVAKEPARLEAVDAETPFWLIDPIDGTANFAAGRPVFAVMVALVVGGEIAGAWIHAPVTGHTAVAEAGAGAWHAGRRLRAAVPDSLGEMRGTLHAGRYGGPALARRVEALRTRLGAIRSLRCAGQEYVRLAAGEMHYCLFTKLMPWDHAPGVLLFREAGGLARLCDGRDYRPAITEGPPLLMAGEPDLWAHLKGLLWPD